MKEVLILYKSGHPEAQRLANAICSALAKKNIDFHLSETGKKKIPQDISLAILLGGDGTIISAARKLVGRDIPILGLNFGTVGFLAPFEPHEWQAALTGALNHSLSLSSYLTLAWELRRSGKLVNSGSAINDIVIARGSMARLVNLKVKIDGKATENLRSDGVVIASPLGSAGYSASAGGPILDPGLNALALVPICPYSACPAPLVLKGQSKIATSLSGAETDGFLTIDGQEGESLFPGDQISVWGKPDSIQFLQAEDRFFCKLAHRGCIQPKQDYSCQNTKL